MAIKKDAGHLTEKDIARFIITSKDRAEDFIHRWMKRHKTSRESAIEKLNQWGIELSRLPESQL